MASVFIYFWVRNHYNLRGLKQHTFIILVSMGQDSMHGLIALFASESYNVEIKVLAGFWYQLRLD